MGPVSLDSVAVSLDPAVWPVVRSPGGLDFGVTNPKKLGREGRKPDITCLIARMAWFARFNELTNLAEGNWKRA